MDTDEVKDLKEEIRNLKEQIASKDLTIDGFDEIRKSGIEMRKLLSNLGVEHDY